MQSFMTSKGAFCAFFYAAMRDVSCCFIMYFYITKGVIVGYLEIINDCYMFVNILNFMFFV